MPRRYLYFTLGVLAPVAALAIPGFAQPWWGVVWRLSYRLRPGHAACQAHNG